MNVKLNEDQQNYIQKQLESGSHSDAKDVLLNALNLKMEQDAQEQVKVKALESAILEGEQSCFTPWDINEVMQGAKQKINA